MELLPDQDGDGNRMNAVGWTDSIVDNPAPRPNFRVSPSSMEGTDVGAVIGENVKIGTGMGVMVFSKPSDLGDCVHSYMAVAVAENDESPKLAEKVVQQWGAWRPRCRRISWLVQERICEHSSKDVGQAR